MNISRNPWSILWVTTTASATVFLDSTVMPVALPTLQREFNFSETGLVWVVNSYLLALMSFMLIGGRLCDLWGLRKSFQWGLFFFTLGSILSGLGFSKFFLLFGRVLQGGGGALLIPATAALIIDAFPLGQRAKAVGINTGISSIFLILGPVVGGVLTQFVSWRMIFFLNVPIACFAFWMAHVKIPKRPPRQETFHFFGASLLSVSIIFLVVALMQGEGWGWLSSKTLLCFGAFPLFFFWFLYSSNRHPHPILSLKIFSYQNFKDAAFCIFLTQILVMATVLWAIYFQESLNYSASKTGLLILIATIPVAFFAPIGGILADRLNVKIPMLAGFILLFFSLVYFAFYPGEKTIVGLLPGLLLFGCGVPLVFSPAVAMALSNVPAEKLGTSSGIITTIRQLASTVGIALMTALFYGVGKENLAKGFSTVAIFSAALAFIGALFTLFFVKSDRQHLERDKRFH